MALRGLGFQPADVMNLVQDFVNKENNRPGSTKCNPWTKVYLALGKKNNGTQQSGKIHRKPRHTNNQEKAHILCKSSIIVGRFKRADIFPLHKNAVSISSLKRSLTLTMCYQVQVRCTLMGFKLLLIPITPQFHDKKKESERYDIERGYPPWYDAHVYKKLKRNLQKDLNSQTDGPIKPKDTDTDTATTNPKDLVNITRKYVV